MSQLNITFNKEPGQKEFYFDRARNQVYSGGFNSGKTFVGCLKAITLLTQFPNYRMVIARLKYTDLRKTTMSTFFSLCPTQIVASHSDQNGITTFTNGSLIYWMHLDKVDTNTLRGLEINAILVDQAEEVEESVFWILDSRLGRWDAAQVPQSTLDQFPTWPRNKKGNPIVPSYHMLLVNPDNQFHWIYRYFHPDSQERKPNFSYVSSEWDPTLGSREAYDIALQRDEEWVAKYVKGLWVAGESQLHSLKNDSLLTYNEDFLKEVLSKSRLYRTMDHGDSAPTAVVWWAAYKGIYIGYREYYMPNRTISEHRHALSELSASEKYSGNYADPSITRKSGSKDEKFFTVADEYRSSAIKAPSISWTGADNNEFATRNRINELLRVSTIFRHPITGNSPAPGIYFIQQAPDYQYGCKHVIRQISMQKKVVLGEIDGKKIYSDERDPDVEDHAYDNLRYFVAIHGSAPADIKPPTQPLSFNYYLALAKRNKDRANSSN